MKKINHILFICLALVGVLTMSSCDKEEVVPIYEKPVWVAQDNADYTVSMVAVVDLPQEIKADYQEGDMMAAFIDDACRAVAQYREGAFYMLIKGSADEQGQIVFKYYSGKKKFLYQSAEKVAFEVDGVYGTTDEPMIPNFQRLGK